MKPKDKENNKRKSNEITEILDKKEEGENKEEMETESDKDEEG